MKLRFTPYDASEFVKFGECVINQLKTLDTMVNQNIWEGDMSSQWMRIISMT
jgi:hypothetical protein